MARRAILPALALLLSLVAVPWANATPNCFGHAATIVGTDKSDVLVGTSAGDVIAGLGGEDRIYGRQGDDYLCGGYGSDRIMGGSDNDSIQGGPDNDGEFYPDPCCTRGEFSGLVGGGGEDLIHGGPGSDEISGDGFSSSLPGADTLYGDAGADFLCDAFCWAGSQQSTDRANDDLFGGSGSDELKSSGGHDLQVGGNGDDELGYNDPPDLSGYFVVDTGNDTYQGSAGNDILRAVDGVAGNDTVDGGDDQDICTGDFQDRLNYCEAIPGSPS